MATLNIDGVGRVTVDDTFLKLSPDEQAKTVEEIVASVKPKAAPAPAPAAQAPAPAPKKSGSLLRTAGDFGMGLADSVSLGFSDEAYGAGKAALQKLTGNDKPYSELYDQGATEARDRLADAGPAATVGQVAGIFVPGTGFVKAGNALLKLGKVAPTAVKSAAASGLITGGLYGAGSAEGDLADRATGALGGAATGVAAGAAGAKGVQLLGKAGGAITDKIKDIAGVAVPVEKLSAEAQALVKAQAPGTTEVSSKAAKALEKLSENPNSVASDIRVRELFLSEKARVGAADPQRAIPDDEIFKNVGDKLKQTAVGTVEALRKSGEIDTEAAKEAKAIISRAARHNRAITGEIKDEELAKELARGFRTDDAIIEALNISGKAKEAIKAAVKDLDTVTFNSMKKNQGGIFEALGSMAGKTVGTVGGMPGQLAGKAIGGGTGRLVDKVLLQQGTAPVLKRSMERVAQGLDEAGVAAGDTVADLTAVGQDAIKGAAAKALAQKQAAAALESQNLATRNEVLKDTRMPLGGGFQELLTGGKSGLNLNTDEAIQGLRLLARKGGAVGDGAKQILQSPKELLNNDVFYGVQNALRKLQEKGVVGTAPVKNPEKYQAAAIANAIKEALKKEEPMRIELRGMATKGE